MHRAPPPVCPVCTYGQSRNAGSVWRIKWKNNTKLNKDHHVCQNTLKAQLGVKMSYGSLSPTTKQIKKRVLTYCLRDVDGKRLPFDVTDVDHIVLDQHFWALCGQHPCTVEVSVLLGVLFERLYNIPLYRISPKNN